MLAHTRYPAASSAPAAALPIVLVHGLGGTQFVWSTVVASLRELGEVVTLDLPGFGASPAPAEQWSVAGAARAVADTIRELGVDRCILVGHSLGGGVSVRVAADNPDLVAALALVAPAGFRGNGSGDVSEREVHTHMLQRLAMPVAGATVLRIPAIRARVLSRLVHDTDQIDGEQAFQFARGSSRGRSTVEARAAILAEYQLDRVTQLAMPTYVLWGTDDVVTPVDMAPVLGGRIPDVEVEVLDSVGHMPHWERPAEFLAGMRRLSSRVD